MVSFLLLGALCAADGCDGLFQPSDESTDYFRLGKSRVNVFGKGGATDASAIFCRRCLESRFNLSYGAELRAESTGRVKTLWESNQAYYEQLAHAAFSTHFPGVQVIQEKDRHCIA